MDFTFVTVDLSTLRNNIYAVICTDEAPALKPVSKESNVNYNFVTSQRSTAWRNFQKITGLTPTEFVESLKRE